ncbi:MAG: ABC transporter permease subunit [Halodesulfurarchaeum sp.]
MTWLVIARKEFEDALRSRMLWAIVVLIAAMTSLAAGVMVLVPGVSGDPVSAIGAASQFAAMLVPIMALIAGYLAIAGERESGSLKILLGLPPSRGEVLLGKFLGRAGVVGIGVGAGFAISGVITRALYGVVPVLDFVGVTLLSAALGICFVGIAVGISATTAVRSRAMTLAVAAYLVLTLLWDMVPQGVHLVVAGSMPGATVPGWFLLLQRASPSGAYNTLVQRVLVDTDAALAARLGGEVPAYLDAPFFLGILVLWTILPLVFGYRRFRRADLS